MPSVNGTGGHDGATASTKSSKHSVEKIYQKKSQLEHILLRPDSYIGSVEFVTEQMYVFDVKEDKMLQRDVAYVPGLYKIFDEILVNAADNKQRDSTMNKIKIEVDPETGMVSVYNNGKGIPVAMHKEEKMYVPTMIFGHLLTSSNYDDEEQKVTGGRNGYGAKLCNIFSTKFTVETSSRSCRKSFKQSWHSNMSQANEPKIGSTASEDFTKVTFYPDLKKFGMEKLDDDIVGLIKRRAYDIAGASKGVKVFFNNTLVPVKNFKDYIDLYISDKTDETGSPLKCVYEKISDRWEVGITISEKGYQHMSFVNSIATTKGGRHVDYITDMVVKGLVDSLKKKNKTGVTVKPFQIKNHMWVFVNCLIVNPTFDSQTKENMTKQAKSFGSKCALNDKFIANVTKCGIVESVMAWAKFKQQSQLNSKCTNKKQNKIKGVPKLEDANQAGTRTSSQCTLILTEGDSAKTTAVAGVSKIPGGRDVYGVFPLKGKVLNVREANHKQILENAEINNIIKIVGLQHKRKYETEEDLKSLRYGKLMIMTDQDQDGSHIKGLLINFIHHFWPSLLRIPFLQEFITPIVKATKAKESFSFYSLPEFEEWKKDKENWHTYKIKYYKGLGTSTSIEAREYFENMSRHKIDFNYSGNQDDHAITMAFSKKMVDQRKEWLTTWMEECKRRNELGLPEVYLYHKDTKSVDYTDFINKELVLFSNLDNERSIPSLVDGFKPGQRKVMYTCMKRNDKREIKVAQLAGSVAEHSAYHHGEASLMSTIINLAHNFIGSNNINLLLPIGQFGTRLQGGKDSASPRYIFTMLSPLTRHIFHPHDDPVLKNNYDDSQKIEPQWYCPIIPMILVNGAEGIGTGWSTKIQNYNPREVIENIRKLIDGEEPTIMVPWFKNYRGEIKSMEYNRFVVNGEIGRLAHNKYEITELPVREWTQHYKENTMEPLLNGSDKSPSLISEYLEYHTDITVKFVVTLPETSVHKIEAEPHKYFKLTSTISTNSMVLFDANGVLKRYDSVDEIMKEFFGVRMTLYIKRKKYMVGILDAEAHKLSNQARFILEKCDGRLVIENKKKKEMIAELASKGFESDPVKVWKIQQNRADALNDQNLEMDGSGDEEETANVGGPDFDYLLGMAMWNLTKEKKDELLKKKDDKIHELETLKSKTPSELWKSDLAELLKMLDEVEEKERQDEAGHNKIGSKKKEVKGSKTRKVLNVESMPSPRAKKIVAKLDPELLKRIEKAAALRNKATTKKIKKEVVEDDEFDDLVSTNTGVSLANRLGNSPDTISKAAKETKKSSKDDGFKQSKLNFKKVVKDEYKSGESSDDNSDDYVSDDEVVVRERNTAGRRAATTKIKYNFDEDEDEDEEINDSFQSNDGINEDKDVPEQVSNLDDSIRTEPEPEPEEVSILDDSIPTENIRDSSRSPSPAPKPKSLPPAPKPKSAPASKPKSKPAPKPEKEIVISDTDSEFESKMDKYKTVAKKESSADLFDSLMSESGSPVKSTIPPKRTYDNDSDSEDSIPPPPPKKQTKSTKPKPKMKFDSDMSSDNSDTPVKANKRKPTKTIVSDDDDDMFDSKPANNKKAKKSMDSDDDMDFEDVKPREKSGRSRKPASYNFVESESDSDY